MLMDDGSSQIGGVTGFAGVDSYNHVRVVYLKVVTQKLMQLVV
jgi:hypothetical protein